MNDWIHWNTWLYCGISFFVIFSSFRLFIFLFPERRRQSKITRVVIEILIFIICILETWDSERAFIVRTQIFVYGIINAGILKVYLNCRFSTSLAWMWFYNFTFSLLKIPLLTWKGIVNNTDLSINISGERDLSESICSFFILIIWLIVFFRYKEKIRYFFNEKHLSYLIILGDCIIYIILTYMMKSTGGYFQKGDLIENISLLFAVLAMLTVFTIFILYRQEKQEQANLVIRQEMIERENILIKSYCEQDAKSLHDLKHTFLYLKKCLELNELEKIKKCLDSHLEEIYNLQKKMWTGIPDVDYILNYEYGKMNREAILFKADIELYSIPLSGEHLMIIVGNLLDNAIEAAEECPEGERKIWLELKNRNSMLQIKIKNTMVHSLKKSPSRLISRKDDQIRHGWGLENVKQLVGEYDGYIAYEYYENIFKVEVLI